MLGLLSSFHFRTEFLIDAETQEVETPFGNVTVFVGLMGGRETACIQRYGPDS